MAYIRRMRNKWQVLIRKKGHPHISKTFATYSEATKHAQETEANIAKGLYADLSEANQTLLKDALQRYRDEVTPKKKGAAQLPVLATMLIFGSSVTMTSTRT